MDPSYIDSDKCLAREQNIMWAQHVSGARYHHATTGEYAYFGFCLSHTCSFLFRFLVVSAPSCMGRSLSWLEGVAVVIAPVACCFADALLSVPVARTLLTTYKATADSNERSENNNHHYHFNTTHTTRT